MTISPRLRHPYPARFLQQRTLDSQLRILHNDLAVFSKLRISAQITVYSCRLLALLDQSLSDSPNHIPVDSVHHWFGGRLQDGAPVRHERTEAVPFDIYSSPKTWEQVRQTSFSIPYHIHGGDYGGAWVNKNFIPRLIGSLNSRRNSWLPAAQCLLGLEELAASLRWGLAPQIREAGGLIRQ